MAGSVVPGVHLSQKLHLSLDSTNLLLRSGLGTSETEKRHFDGLIWFELGCVRFDVSKLVADKKCDFEMLQMQLIQQRKSSPAATQHAWMRI
jgi:hypothetical protein